MPMINGELIFNLMVLVFIILNINSDFNLGIEDGKLENSRLIISEFLFFLFCIWGSEFIRNAQS